MYNSWRNYLFLFIVFIILFVLTDQCGNNRDKTASQPQRNTEFDPATYVDPYGTTTCYPSDFERTKRRREQNSRKTLQSPQTTAKGLYHYRVTVSNVHREWDRHEQETLADGTVRLRKIYDDLSYINGTYEWDMDLYITDNDELLSYIINNYNTLKKYKVNGTSSNIYDEYNDRFDEYLDDPEDEITFDPDIFNFLDD